MEPVSWAVTPVENTNPSEAPQIAVFVLIPIRCPQLRLTDLIGPPVEITARPPTYVGMTPSCPEGSPKGCAASIRNTYRPRKPSLVIRPSGPTAQPDPCEENATAQCSSVTLACHDCPPSADQSSPPGPTATAAPPGSKADPYTGPSRASAPPAVHVSPASDVSATLPVASKSRPISPPRAIPTPSAPTCTEVRPPPTPATTGTSVTDHVRP